MIRNQKILDGLRDLKQMNKDLERAVFEAIKSGDENVKNRLIESGLNFVAEIARQCESSEVEYGDLFSELSVVLLEAIRDFDSMDEVLFVDYLTELVEKCVNECYNHLTWLLPIDYRMVQLHDRYELALKDLYPKCKNPEDRAVQDEEYVADYLEISVEQLRAMKAEYAKCRVESTNKLVYASGPINYDVGNWVPLIETIVDPRTDVIVDHRSGTTISDELDDLMGGLTAEERRVVCQREGVLSHEMEKDEKIALGLGVGKNDVETIYQRAMGKLNRAGIASKTLRKS